jgi:membrane peptidoglycan carboxypeptidase
LVLLALQVTLPDVAYLRATNPTRSRYMRLRAHERGLDERAYTIDWVPLARIAPVLVCAVVKAEDGRFFRHAGFEWSQIQKAVSHAWHRESRMGGSTISQQVARNLFLDPSPSLFRKAREALLARRMERTLAKERILELYLNVIEWGDGIWGAKPASARYFGKAPDALDPFEAIFLAALIAAPRHDLAGANLRRGWAVQVRVLHQLYFAGLVDEVEWRSAIARASAVRDRLLKGISLDAALAERGVQSPSWRIAPRLDETRLPWDQAISEECGLEREAIETDHFRKLHAEHRRAGADDAAAPRVP